MTMKVKADRKLRTRVSHPSSIIVPTSDIKAPIQLAHLRVCRWFRLQKSFCCNLNTYREERGKNGLFTTKIHGRMKAYEPLKRNILSLVCAVFKNADFLIWIDTVHKTSTKVLEFF